MSRSFLEIDHQKGMNDIRKKLESLEEEMRDLSRQQISTYLIPLVKYYETASAYLNARKNIMVSYSIKIILSLFIYDLSNQPTNSIQE